MAVPHVRGLYRFPVKGFPAQQLDVARVRAGSGIDGDRAVGLSNGLEPPRPDEWAGCMTFTALKVEKSLQSWHVSAHVRGAATDITLTAPDGESVSFASDDEVSLDAATPFLTSRLVARGPNERVLVSTGQGIFDSRLSGLSLINAATVEALGRSADVELDPRRFRGNLVLDGLAPYEEWHLIGAVLRIGEVRVWVRQAIERCSATRVNPVTAGVDINVPQLLAAHLGHLHCGIYGVVLSDGEIREGDQIVVERPPSPGLPEGVPREAYKTRTYPRAAVVQRSDLSDGVVALRLRDGLGWTRDHFTVGQNLRVHPVIDGVPTWRTYTITRVSPAGPAGTADDIDLLIKLDGVVSQHLAALETGDELIISGPYGRVVPDVLGDAPATITAGIGITPALALARAGVGVRALHVGRDVDSDRLVAELAGLTDVTPWSTTQRGRPDAGALAAWLGEAPTSSVLVCGPAGLGETVREAARLVGIQDVHEEVFASPVIVQGEPDLPPATVELDGVAVPWTPGGGFILDALEAAGLDVPSECRGGACGTCGLTLARGEVTYPLEPAAAQDGVALTCCSYPVGELVLARQ